MFGNVSEQAAVLAIIARTRLLWHEAATLIEIIGSAHRLLQREWPGLDAVQEACAAEIADAVTADDLTKHQALIDSVIAEGCSLVTVLDGGYPANLREVHNRPPFLFVRGDLDADDRRAIAVVGTRMASDRGLATAARIAAELAESGTTVLSGMAAGIDTAAHTAALDVGGRTVAVFGTGIRRIYPAANRDLAKRIARQGATVSQFWPDAPPTKVSFPMRNVVTSGMAIGTVVVEASRTSGAKSQASHCLAHGKRLFLVEELVLQEEWAKKYAERPGTTVISSTDDILQVVNRVVEAPQQMSLC